MSRFTPACLRGGPQAPDAAGGAPWELWGRPGGGGWALGLDGDRRAALSHPSLAAWEAEAHVALAPIS